VFRPLLGMALGFYLGTLFLSSDPTGSLLTPLGSVLPPTAFFSSFPPGWALQCSALFCLAVH
jgi:hypothetical protein